MYNPNVLKWKDDYYFFSIFSSGTTYLIDSLNSSSCSGYISYSSDSKTLTNLYSYTLNEAIKTDYVASSPSSINTVMAPVVAFKQLYTQKSSSFCVKNVI